MNKDHGIKVFLNMILDGLNFSIYDFSQEEAPIIELAKELGYATGFTLEKANFVNPPNYEYYVVENPGENIRVTKKGYKFMSNNSPTNYEKTESNLKKVLIDIDNRGSIRTSDFDNISYEDYKELVSKAFVREYIIGINIIRGGQGNKVRMIMDNNLELTEKGNNFIVGKEQNSMTTNNTYNFNAPVNNSAIGDNNSVTNNLGPSLKELQKFISTMSPDDQTTANEILDVVKNQDVEPGMFSRFTEFFEKHPTFVNALGHSAVWLLTNADKLPLL